MPAITLRDPIYGEHQITEALLIDLLTSSTLDRLKGIGQFGVPEKYYHKASFSRYDHSVGVMLLLRIQGANLTEQAAGLLHDASHRAFSHVYDLVMDDYSQPNMQQNRQDQDHAAFLATSTILGIATKYGLTTDQLADLTHYSLLDADAPHLCADRVDYALREFPLALAQDLVPHLIVHQGRLAFDNHNSAVQFGLSYLQLQRHNWGSSEHMARYYYFAEVIKRALAINVITADDFWLDDAAVMEMIEASNDEQIRYNLAILRSKAIPVASPGKRIFGKFRFVDPLVITNKHSYRLSDREPNFHLLLSKARVENQRGVAVQPM